ncbi:hypothetical protein CAUPRSCDRAFT_12883 [Caulochytrium protostelioides]|nr:hypothetical protein CAUPRSCDRAFT_12883 [Caulochytrium protostelioides]
MAASATAASATATSVTAVTTTATAATASTTTTSDLLKLKEGAKEGDAEPTSEASASPQPLPTYGFTPGLQTRPLILGDEENGEVGEDGKPKPTSAPGLWEGNNCRLSIRIREAGGLPTLKKTNSPYVILAVKRQEFLTRNDANGRTNPDFEGETFHWDDVDPKVHRLYAQINTDNHHMIAVNPSVKLDFLTTVPRTTSGQQPYVWKYPIPLWDDEAYLAGHLLLEMQARC